MDNNLIMICTNHEDKLASWQFGLSGYTYKNLKNLKLESLCEAVITIKPAVLLLDYDFPGLNNLYGVSSLRKLCTETKVVILTSIISESVEWELLQAGVRGCCRDDVKPKVLNQVVNAVQQGEMWISRTLTCRLVDELGKTTSKNKAYRASLGLLNKLTQREYDIAMCVGNGQSNKQIAQSCAITERTVKAHLTEIFIKLGISDRLNLALVLSADEKAGLANMRQH